MPNSQGVLSKECLIKTLFESGINGFRPKNI